MEGASFDSIVRYVQRYARMTEERAAYLVMEALKAGVALGAIRRNKDGSYVLVSTGPGTIVQKIKEPRLTDDSDSEASSEESV